MSPTQPIDDRSKEIILPTVYPPISDENLKKVIDDTADEVFDATEEFIHPDIRVIETEDQVKEVIAEMNAIEDPKAKALAKQQLLAATMKKMDALWKGMSRKQKRSIVRKRNPGLKFSNRVKKALQIKDNQS